MDGSVLKRFLVFALRLRNKNQFSFVFRSSISSRTLVFCSASIIHQSRNSSTVRKHPMQKVSVSSSKQSDTHGDGTVRSILGVPRCLLMGLVGIGITYIYFQSDFSSSIISSILKKIPVAN